MRLRYHSFVSIVVALIALPVLAGEQSLPYPRDPQTGRAIGAQEMPAAELKKKLDAGEPVLVIEVRDASFYEKETIPGAIHMPFAHLQEALKDIPKDRTLVFT
jgi:rhodanese-like protein